MTIRESYVDLIAHLRQERDELKQTIASLRAEIERLKTEDEKSQIIEDTLDRIKRSARNDWVERAKITLDELARDTGQHDLPVSGLQRGLEDDGEGY